MSSQQVPTNNNDKSDNFTKFMMALSEAMNSGSGELTFKSSSEKPTETIVENRIKLTELNWQLWAENVIRNLKGEDILYLFKGLEEEDFKNAMEVEKNENQKARDASTALKLIHAGLDDEAIRYLKSTSDVKKCWKMLKERYKVSTSSLHAGLAAEIIREMAWREGSWTDIMSKIDSEMASMPKIQLRSQSKVNETPTPSQPRTDQNQQRPKIKCYFCEKTGHRESECRGKKAWEQRRVAANMSQLDKDKSSEE
ncbi:hypothetical protein CFO_g4484 [Ceratocystis platani]|uniref:CCHC-type domain-containing protein n=1 Tax=Ceratocystis fimbriata f. sp. platani TaxID=88771 RepID=A0A0F8CQY4_CERFI|nr:hypothetical protein CFO_g4484 [Ceratocystis platani]